MIFRYKQRALARLADQGPADHFPALAWLSLAGVLASRAPLRFTRQR